MSDGDALIAFIGLALFCFVVGVVTWFAMDREAE